MTVTCTGNALLVRVNATGATITVDDQFYSQTQHWGVERLLSRMATVGICLRSPRMPGSGTSGNDTLNASVSADILFGDKGNDYLQGNDGSDTYLYRSGTATMRSPTGRALQQMSIP